MRTATVFAAVLFIPILLVSAGTAQTGREAAPGEEAGREGVIHGFAFNDLDKDGVRDPGESGLPGTVICLAGNWCDHTEWGEFEFDMLYPGAYKVELTEWPDGYFLLSANPVTVVLQEGQFVQQVDFALSNDPEGVIRGLAFVDADRDGVKDTMEEGLDSVQVCLVGHNWCNYTEWGEYEFDLLPPGDYTVRVQSFPKGYHPTSPRTIHLTLADAQVRADVHFGFRRDNRRVK